MAASRETSGRRTVKTQQSFFEEEGVVINVRVTPTGKDAHDSLLTGSADAATVSDRVLSATSVPGIVPLAKILETPLIYALSLDSSAVTSAKDFRNKRIGVVSGTIAAHVIEDYLREIAVDPGDWPEIRRYPTPDAIFVAKSLAAGHIQFFIGWQPYIGAIQAALQSEGSAGIRRRLPFLSPPRIRFHLVVRSEILIRPGLARGIARSLLRASKFVKGYKVTTLQILRDTLGSGFYAAGEDWDEYDFTVSFPDSVLLDYLLT